MNLRKVKSVHSSVLCNHTFFHYSVIVTLLVTVALLFLHFQGVLDSPIHTHCFTLYVNFDLYLG